MKVSELHALGDNELAAALDEAYEELFKLRFNRASGQQKNHARLREARRNIARVRTIIRERELAEEG